MRRLHEFTSPNSPVESGALPSSLETLLLPFWAMSLNLSAEHVKTGTLRVRNLAMLLSPDLTLCCTCEDVSMFTVQAKCTRLLTTAFATPPPFPMPPQATAAQCVNSSIQICQFCSHDPYSTSYRRLSHCSIKLHNVWHKVMIFCGGMGEWTVMPGRVNGQH